MSVEQEMRRVIEAYMKEKMWPIRSAAMLADGITDREQKMRALIQLHILHMLNMIFEKQLELIGVAQKAK